VYCTIAWLARNGSTRHEKRLGREGRGPHAAEVRSFAVGSCHVHHLGQELWRGIPIPVEAGRRSPLSHVA